MEISANAVWAAAVAAGAMLGVLRGIWTDRSLQRMSPAARERQASASDSLRPEGKA